MLIVKQPIEIGNARRSRRAESTVIALLDRLGVHFASLPTLTATGRQRLSS